MTMRVSIVAPPAAAGLAGLTGQVGGADFETVVAGARSARPPADVAILLGGAAVPDPGGVAVEWAALPWPAADDLLAEPGPPGPGAALVVAADQGRRDELTGNLAQRSVPVLARDRLSREDLLGAACVVLVAEAAGELPREAMAVLAAGRVLVVGECTPAFGLLAGVDHLAVADDGEAADHADAVVSHPEAFRLVRAMGRAAARGHRASLVYPRIVRDLELRGVIEPRRAGGGAEASAPDAAGA